MRLPGAWSCLLVLSCPCRGRRLFDEGFRCDSTGSRRLGVLDVFSLCGWRPGRGRVLPEVPRGGELVGSCRRVSSGARREGTKAPRSPTTAPRADNFLSDSIALSPRRRRVQCLSLSLDKLVPFISVSVSSFANRERRAAHSTEHGARSRQPTILFYSPNRSPL